MKYPNWDRHYELLELIAQERDPEKKKKLCQEDIALLPAFRKDLVMRADETAKKSMELGHMTGETHPFEYYKAMRKSAYIMPSYPSFKVLATIYEKEGDYSSAIEVCKAAIQEGFADDKTKGGMAGRIEKLEKKLSK